jgi:rSAM/selenodomain-associated transferase 2
VIPLSIIIPALNEATHIATFLQHLAPLRADGAQVIVVDGGSSDATPALAQPLAGAVICAPRGRATQMNAGARSARGNVLLFLHADSRVPQGSAQLILDGLAQSGRLWGRFDVRIEGQHRLLPVIAWFMNLRSRLTGIATGDQGIFVSREAFEHCGGFPEIALMEDIALCKALGKLGPPLCLRARIATSGRRWEKHGALRTILLMWRLRLAYFFGADPARLAKIYYGQNS